MRGAGKDSYIQVKGAKENNLKNISVDIPTDKLVCVTGVSGGGKSSLVYDTLYAESRRVLFDSMDINLFGQKMLEKPNVDSIENMRTAVSLAQNSHNANPRSTVGTVTEVSYALRNIFSLSTNGEKKSNFFSANNPSSYCSKCKGTGLQLFVDFNKVVPDQTKTLNQGAIACFSSQKKSQEFKLLEAFCFDQDINMDIPFNKLLEIKVHLLLYTDKTGPYELSFRTPKGRTKKKSLMYVGAIKELNQKVNKTESKSALNTVKKYVRNGTCSLCKGKKLAGKVLDIKVLEYSISDVESMTISDCVNWLNNLINSKTIDDSIKSNKYLITNSVQKLEALKELSVDYLTLSRSIPTLSSGEMQRVRIAKYLSSALVGLVYIFDEPCKGLHPRDINQIETVISRLVAGGNSVISIEHNKQFLSSAEYLLEMGPVGGPKGGFLLRQGPSAEFEDLFSVDYHFKNTGKITENFMCFTGINYRNIINQTVEIPRLALTCITGVSGSGKSTLSKVIMDCVSSKIAINCDSISGIEPVSGVRYINQSPIGKTNRSTVVSYLGIYDQIRTLFSNSAVAQKRKITASNFSMNLPGGRCENCQGTGRVKVDVNYLPETYIRCDVCNGKRFNEKVLDIEINGFNISDILNTEAENLLSFFQNEKSIKSMIQCLIDVGLGYIKLGQLSMDISGGESQRIKLAKELGKKSIRNYVYFLDEPTSGLGYEESQRIGIILSKLCNDGNTVIAIEHNLEFILHFTDYIIDLGLSGGNKGGRIKYQGPTRGVFKKENTSWYDISIGNALLQ